MEKIRMETYRVLLKGGVGTFEEKKSKFIATVYAVNTEEEAMNFIEETKKKYWDANHNCWAFVLGEKGQIARCSDDGEPSGTAGRPMLEVLLGEEIRNVVVVVTRYFGGTLLGTGGLVRAYTLAVKEGLKESLVGRMVDGCEIAIHIDYNGIGKILYILGQYNIEVYESDYGTEVMIKIRIPNRIREKLENECIQGTHGRVKWRIEKTLYFIDKE